MSVAALISEIGALADARHAAFLATYFQTGAGGYGEGDVFLGVRNPDLRAAARRYRALPADSLAALLGSPVPEHRFVALAILDDAARRAEALGHERLARFYLDHADRVNNWDLVDCSAPRVLGGWLARRTGPAAKAESAAILDALAGSAVMWRRRIAVMASWGYIRSGRIDVTCDLVDRLSTDPHHLMHKAMGWMLREVSKGDEAALRRFLDTRPALPRTTVRYAIERLAPEIRQGYVRAARVATA
mgnify:CR=1 FL=1